MHVIFQHMLFWVASQSQTRYQFELSSLEPFLSLVSGLFGALFGSAITWFISVRGRRQNYYIALVRYIIDHNWSSLRESTGSGLISTVDDKVRTTCLQHINLLFFAWLHFDVIKRDGSVVCWKAYAMAIVAGSQARENGSFRAAYYETLTHSHIYPPKFLKWLDKRLGMSKESFAAKPEPAPPLASVIGEDRNAS